MNTICYSRYGILTALLFVVSGCGPTPIAHSDADAETVPAAKYAPLIRLHGDKPPAIEVTGLSSEDLKALARLKQTSEQWQALFALYVERSGDRSTQPAVGGSYRVSEDALRFEPKYPLVRGLSYRVVFHPALLPGHAGSTEQAVEKVVQLPKVKPAEPTVVAHVYPSKDELPENQLKFYLHFSAPMSRGDVYAHIHLLRSDGRPDEYAFLDLPQELWDPDSKRLTLYLDPGRIKRGLKPREDIGPVLESGKRYTLVIDRDFRDGEGNPLKETYRKEFRVLPPDETQPDPKKWRIEPPLAGTTATLVVISSKTLDHALLNRMLWVTDDKEQKVAGKVEVTNRETRWCFTPATAWKAGLYHLVADTRLEDLAGNSIGRPFEVDVLHPSDGKNKAETVRVPFDVR